MGKSTTAQLFRDAGIPVWAADAAVHRLYASGGAAVEPIAALYPTALMTQGINRAVLKALIATDPAALDRIEAIVHPLVAADRAAFLAETTADIAVFDIPLLFEKSSEDEFHATLLVTAPVKLQRSRVLNRPSMTKAQLDFILSRQMSDIEKRQRATYIIETVTFEKTRSFVHALIAYIRQVKHA